jgi:hypothetical protein
MQKLLLVVAVPLVFACVLVAVEFPAFGWIGFVAPVALFVWLLRRMGNAPPPPEHERPVVVPAAAADDDVVDALFDDEAAPTDPLATIARYPFAIDARQARDRLQAAGIAAVLANDHTAQALGFAPPAQGGVALQVPTAQAAAAASVLEVLGAPSGPA